MTRYVALLRGLNSALAEDELARELVQAIETAWREAHGDLAVGPAARGDRDQPEPEHRHQAGGDDRLSRVASPSGG